MNLATTGLGSLKAVPIPLQTMIILEFKAFFNSSDCFSFRLSGVCLNATIFEPILSGVKEIYDYTNMLKIELD